MTATLDFKDELAEEEGLLGKFFTFLVFRIYVIVLFYLYNSSFRFKEKDQSLMKSFVQWMLFQCRL